MLTVQQLYKELEKLIQQGYGDLEAKGYDQRVGFLALNLNKRRRLQRRKRRKAQRKKAKKTS